MIILELGLLTQQTIFSFDAPFCCSFVPSYNIVDATLKSTFGLEDNLNTLYINGFVRGPFVDYQTVDSYANYLTTEKSFYWDNDNQIGYVHFEHEYYYDTDLYSYETYDIYNDLDIIYIDDQESLPLIKSVPGIRKQQDIVNYNKLAFNSGTATLNNIQGLLDKYKDRNIYGNNAFLSYIDPDDITIDESGTMTASRDDIQKLSAYYIDDYDFKVDGFSIDLKDRRAAQNNNICTDIYTLAEYPGLEDDYINKPIQLVFGTVRESEAVPVSSGVNVTYRAGLEITDFGTVQVLNDKTWTTVTPAATSSNGEFILLGSDALNDDGEPLECRLLGATGISITYASDVIKWLNEYYSFTDYNSSTYNTTEWEAEEVYLSEIGIVFKDQIKLYEAIQKIQSGSNYGFRYDFNSEGKRTIRIDREDRDLECKLDNLLIMNRFELPVKSDRELVYSYIDIQYNRSFSEKEKFDLEQNSGWLSYQQTTRQAKTLTRKTYLINQADAETMAAREALIFRSVPRIADLEISTPTKIDRTNYLGLRIFDIIIVPLTYSDDVDFDSNTITGREYFGFQAIKILSVAPDAGTNKIKVSGKIIEGYEESFVFDFDDWSDDADLYDFGDWSTDSTEFDFDRW